MEKIPITLFLVLDDTMHVTSYCEYGELDNAVPYSGGVPDGFYKDAYPQRYYLPADQLIVDPTFTPPTVSDSNDNVLEDLQSEVAQLSYEVMQLDKGGDKDVSNSETNF